MGKLYSDDFDDMGPRYSGGVTYNWSELSKEQKERERFRERFGADDKDYSNYVYTSSCPAELILSRKKFREDYKNYNEKRIRRIEKLIEDNDYRVKIVDNHNDITREISKAAIAESDLFIVKVEKWALFSYLDNVYYYYAKDRDFKVNLEFENEELLLSIWAIHILDKKMKGELKYEDCCRFYLSKKDNSK